MFRPGCSLPVQKGLGSAWGLVELELELELGNHTIMGESIKALTLWHATCWQWPGACGGPALDVAAAD